MKDEMYVNPQNLKCYTNQKHNVQKAGSMQENMGASILLRKANLSIGKMLKFIVEACMNKLI